MNPLPTPYYERGDICILHGDCLEILPLMEAASIDAVITDPVWPNSTADIPGKGNAFSLFAAAAAHFPRIAQRVAVQMGCDSDPRMLAGLPETMPFFRACWIEYACPHPKGRLLFSGDVAYLFGEPPPARPGHHLVPGRKILTGSTRRKTGHPCERDLDGVLWLAAKYGGRRLCDPFAGSGTLAIAAIRLDAECLLIDVSESYCRVAADRCDRELDQLKLGLEVT